MTDTSYYATEQGIEAAMDRDRGDNPAPSPDDLLYAYLRQYGQVNRQPRVITVASPSAGTDWTVTVQSGQGSGNVVWVPVIVQGTFAASATVANRNFTIAATISGTALRIGLDDAQQGASNTWLHSWSRGGTASSLSGASGVASSLAMLPVPGGSSIGAVTNGLQAGDQWSAIALYVLELTQNDPGYLTDQVQAIRDGSPYFESYPGVELGL